jgi:glycerol dehydrogenase-like iron-containing ADH family enzyme
MSTKLILSAAGALLVAGIAGAVAQTIHIESRQTRTEVKQETTQEKVAELKADVKEIRSDIRQILEILSKK